MASCFGALQVIVAIISFLETMLLMYLSYKVRRTPTHMAQAHELRTLWDAYKTPSSQLVANSL